MSPDPITRERPIAPRFRISYDPDSNTFTDTVRPFNKKIPDIIRLRRTIEKLKADLSGLPNNIKRAHYFASYLGFNMELEKLLRNENPTTHLVEIQQLRALRQTIYNHLFDMLTISYAHNMDEINNVIEAKVDLVRGLLLR